MCWQSLPTACRAGVLTPVIERTQGASWSWNSLRHGPQQLPSLLYGWERLEEHGERKVKAHSVPSVHLQQMFPEEHCPAGSAHSCFGLWWPLYKIFQETTGSPVLCPENPQFTKSWLSLFVVQRGLPHGWSNHSLWFIVPCQETSSLAACGLQLGTWGRGILGLQMLSELDLVTFNSALSQQIWS